MYCRNRMALSPEELEIARKKAREAMRDWRDKKNPTAKEARIAKRARKEEAERRKLKRRCDAFKAWLAENPEALKEFEKAAE